MEQTKFNMIPAREELDSLNREFAFQPSEPSRAHTLTPAQVAEYNRDGFLLGETVLDAEEAVSVREYFDGLLARVLAAGGTSYSISTAHLKHGRVVDQLIGAAPRDRIEALLSRHLDDGTPDV